MDTEMLKGVLLKLENSPSKNENGYSVKEILFELGIAANRDTTKQVRRKLRAMISKLRYPEFKTAGSEDIVYCPNGKESGRYRLSDYREK